MDSLISSVGEDYYDCRLPGLLPKFKGSIKRSRRGTCSSIKQTNRQTKQAAWIPYHHSSWTCSAAAVVADSSTIIVWGLSMNSEQPHARVCSAAAGVKLSDGRGLAVHYQSSQPVSEASENCRSSIERQDRWVLTELLRAVAACRYRRRWNGQSKQKKQGSQHKAGRWGGFRHIGRRTIEPPKFFKLKVDFQSMQHYVLPQYSTDSCCDHHKKQYRHIRTQQYEFQTDKKRTTDRQLDSEHPSYHQSARQGGR